MKELSLNILDITENSVSAKAENISVAVRENTDEGTMIIEIADDGCGMSEEFLKNVLDPFTTTRKTRKVGLGLPLFKLAAEQAGGGLMITSKVGVGTTVRAEFQIDNIDRAPLGDMADTVATLIHGHPDMHFRFIFEKDGDGFEVDTLELREQLGDVPLNIPEVLCWIKDFVNGNLAELKFIF